MDPRHSHSVDATKLASPISHYPVVVEFVEVFQMSKQPVSFRCRYPDTILRFTTIAYKLYLYLESFTCCPCNVCHVVKQWTQMS